MKMRSYRIIMVFTSMAMFSSLPHLSWATTELKTQDIPAPQELLKQKVIRFDQNLGSQLPIHVTMTDEYGQKHEIQSYFGLHPVILVFSYYQCPNLCTLVLNGLVSALKNLPDLLGKDYQILSVSIDPKEKPSLALAKKRAYLARTGVSESEVNEGRLPWHFLTGAEDQIRRLADQAGFHYHKDPVSGEYAHPSGILILTPTGKISQYLFGIQFDPKKLHQALSMAKSNQNGSWVEEILLFCFHYDPKLSQNGPLILSTIRIFGILGVLSLIGLFFYLHRTDRKGRSA